MTELHLISTLIDVTELYGSLTGSENLEGISKNI
jgi:hypothetical protein